MNAGVTEKAVLYSRSRFSWGFSEIGAAKPDGARLLREAPAAFRRLCVETRTFWHATNCPKPAAFRRLCVETKMEQQIEAYNKPAAFRRLCVETVKVTVAEYFDFQPPLGGCVLKLTNHVGLSMNKMPAAFRRLCVETSQQTFVIENRNSSRL